MATKLIYELIPSARKLERRSYRLTPANAVRDLGKFHEEAFNALGPATYVVLDVVMSFLDDVKREATFDEIRRRRGISRTSVAKHLALLVKADLLQALPAQSRLVEIEN